MELCFLILQCCKGLCFWKPKQCKLLKFLIMSWNLIISCPRNIRILLIGCQSIQSMWAQMWRRFGLSRKINSEPSNHKLKSKRNESIGLYVKPESL
jgi:hypothetical protein